MALALGTTIGELQNRMSYREYCVWLNYRAKYGSLNPVRKYNEGAALVAAVVNNAHGGKATVKDFLFYGKDVNDEELSGVALEQFVKSLGGVKIGKRR